MIDLERFGLRVVPIGALKTSLARVRGERRAATPQTLTPTPIRVLADPEDPGRYEVVDGFKRLAAYLEEGLREIVVIVEPAAEGIPLLQQGLVLVLSSNAPRRTLGVMDEARVTRSLVDDAGLGPVAAGRLLGKGKPWVSKRLALSRKLAAEVTREVESGALPLMVAYALCALPRGDQTRLARKIIALDLPASRATLLVQAYRVAATAAERQTLLDDPAGFFEETDDEGESEADRGGDIIGLSPCVRERIAFYTRLSKQLRALEHERPLSGLAANEARLVAAERQRLEAQIADHAHHWSQQATTTEQPTAQES